MDKPARRSVTVGTLVILCLGIVLLAGTAVVIGLITLAGSSAGGPFPLVVK